MRNKLYRVTCRATSIAFKIAPYIAPCVRSLTQFKFIFILQCKSRYMRVFAKEELPKRLHYSYGRYEGIFFAFRH